MKMNWKLIFCPGFLLLLTVSQNQGWARPISSLQSLSKLLEEDLEHPLVSEERDQQQEDMIPMDAFGQQDSEFQWIQKTREQPESLSTSDSAVQKFLSNLLSLPRRYRGRSKKGLSRGCFGVKLDRIGSLSGLGC
ncbi:C-type natriuretic peptide 1-like [Indicator indicator]|uniref:C-type natriuretic peptide 1-like n=1 Tax=Indicator indicator TaxID=1002788 RepID=UPI0023DECFB4|nr:C-type natriuretic peptide 1-like [Indicator indicator]